MTSAQREEELRKRKEAEHPWHSVPLRDSGKTHYLITAACFEHRSVIGRSRERMHRFADALLCIADESTTVDQVHAFVVLPNHYHLLIGSADIVAAKRELGELHGRTSYRWNRKDGTPGRRVWFRAAETVMKSSRHFQATVNYVHGNPVKNGCVNSLGEWPWSSFHEWLDRVGAEKLRKQWAEFPTKGYGKGWDEGDLSREAAQLAPGSEVV